MLPYCNKKYDIIENGITRLLKSLAFIGTILTEITIVAPLLLLCECHSKYTVCPYARFACETLTPLYRTVPELSLTHN